MGTEEKKWCVYIHRNKINNKAYIGITSRAPNIRWKRGEGYCSSSYFYNAIQKYGWDNFEHIIWCEGLTQDEAFRFEKLLIAVFNTTNSDYGYNLSAGGQLGPIGVRCSEKTKEKLRQLNLGGNNPNYGLKRSEETKKKISDALIGKSKTYKNKNGNPLKIFIYQYSKQGDLINKFLGSYKASEQTGISRSAIENCLCGLSKTAGGYIWKKDNEPLTDEDIISVNLRKRKSQKDNNNIEIWLDKQRQKYRVKFKQNGEYLYTKTYSTKEEAEMAIENYKNNKESW